MQQSRYLIGIDLGTTNCAVFYADTQGSDQELPAIQQLLIPQVVEQGMVEERPLLPSFLYLPGENEQPTGSLQLPWDKKRDFAAGVYARNFGSQVPTRLVSSAKSWLCVESIDRHAAILPWKAPEDGRHVSPVSASAEYLKHLRDAWNHTIAKNDKSALFEKQDIILAVPASFDAVARELTMEAAQEAGLAQVTLLEEPQAAVYSWLQNNETQWRDHLQVGDLLLVCDIGGGTTDFSLIAIGESEGNLELRRLAVGEHILLGGDNMDLALAHTVAGQLQAKGQKLSTTQMLQLWHNCRQAKEQLLANPDLASAAVTILGKGSKVIGGSIKTELTQAQIKATIIDAFFAHCNFDEEPKRAKLMGLQELGLPYAADPLICKHLASFLRNNLPKSEKNDAQRISVLFNGGVLKPKAIRDHLLKQVGQWEKSTHRPDINELEGVDLDLSVAKGAAYYGCVRRGQGIRIRGGTARSYYIGIESSLPAIPGIPAPLKALCVVPFGMEEGTEQDVPDHEFGLIVGEEAEFRFFGSTTRKEDAIGSLLEEVSEDMEESSPMSATLTSERKDGNVVPVRLHTRITEIGTLELWCLSRDGKEKWKLEFNVRERN